jgi:predicted helicase
MYCKSGLPGRLYWLFGKVSWCCAEAIARPAWLPPSLLTGTRGKRSLVPSLRLVTTSKPVRDYYASLEQYSLLHATHEGAIRGAFGHVLESCAKKFKWALINEYEIRRKKKPPLRVDGAVVDPWSLAHGYWEAKDQDDDLAAEAKKKLDLGYPDDNIIFQAPDRAILYQRGQRIADENIDRNHREALVEVVNEFFRYEPPHFEEWQKAVEDFKERIPQLAKSLEALVTKERKYTHFEQAFNKFAQVCRSSLNPQLTDEAVERMLVQHILTERIFRKVFDNSNFVRRNAIASEIETVIDRLTERSFRREEFLKSLDRFYKAIEDTAGSIEDFSEKQAFLNKVYESFFQGFDQKTADTHGIVYTPQPIVRFMVRSVDEVLQKEFAKSLSDKGVHILDPFVGTGNFILNVMQHIPKTRLPQKYASELHANEVMLLPYYIASMNIEHEYAELAGQYQQFEGLCLVDTFELAEKAQASFSVMTEKNTQRVEAQKKAQITVIIGNPPYNAWQLSENDGNKNRKYEVVDERIAKTYAKDSTATLVSALGDPYVKAFRWATDRLGDEGVLAYVSNNSYVEQRAFDGMRKNLSKDFDAIYVLDLGGNTRKNPKLSGTTHNVFGIRVGVAIGLFVRRKKSAAARKAEIFYARFDEYWRKEKKFIFLDEHKTVGGIQWNRIEPDQKETWLTEGLQQSFDELMPIAADSVKGNEPEALFATISNGLKSNNDPFVFGFDRDQLIARAQVMVNAYNTELSRWRTSRGITEDVEGFIRIDERELKWIRKTKRHLKRETVAKFELQSIVSAQYRPFTKNYLFFDRMFSEDTYQMEKIWKSGLPNRAIVVKTGSEWPMFVLATDRISEQLPQGGSQVCALGVSDSAGGLRDNVTNWALDQFRSQYDDKRITKWAIFHYVYAILHHSEYRSRYAENFKRELPRVPFAADFWSFSEAGEKLAELHLHYEKQTEYPLKRVETPGVPLDWRVERMKLSKDKTALVYNTFLTLAGIPPETFEYRLGVRSALDWIIDQYEVSTDSRSGIVNDPNRAADPEYIVRLIGQVITVSVETMKIIRAFPPLDDGERRADQAESKGAPKTPLTAQVAALKTLKTGWHEPGVPAPDATLLDHFEAFLKSAIRAAKLSEPFLYATLDGGAQAEWPLKGWELSATVFPKRTDVRLSASSLESAPWRTVMLENMDAAALRAFAKFVQELARSGKTRGN